MSRLHFLFSPRIISLFQRRECNPLILQQSFDLNSCVLNFNLILLNVTACLPTFFLSSPPPSLSHSPIFVSGIYHLLIIILPFFHPPLVDNLGIYHFFPSNPFPCLFALEVFQSSTAFYIFLPRSEPPHLGLSSSSIHIPTLARSACWRVRKDKTSTLASQTFRPDMQINEINEMIKATAVSQSKATELVTKFSKFVPEPGGVVPFHSQGLTGVQCLRA